MRKADREQYEIQAVWEGEECRLSLKNISDQSISPQKIILFTMDMLFSLDTFVQFLI